MYTPTPLTISCTYGVSEPNDLLSLTETIFVLIYPFLSRSCWYACPCFKPLMANRSQVSAFQAPPRSQEVVESGQESTQGVEVDTGMEVDMHHNQLQSTTTLHTTIRWSTDRCMCNNHSNITPTKRGPLSIKSDGGLCGE